MAAVSDVCLRFDHFLSYAAEKETLNGAPSYLINFWGIKSCAN